MPYFLQILGIVIIVGACMLPYILPNWRILVSTLATIYLVQFIFIFYELTPLLAVINLIIGWMACAVLGIAGIRLGESEGIDQYRGGTAFRLISAFFFILTAFALSINTFSWLNRTPYILLAGGLSLVFTGILQMNFFDQVFRIIVSLLVFISGFELIYYSLEFSLLVIVLIGMVKIGLAFIGTYLAMRQLQGVT